MTVGKTLRFQTLLLAGVLTGACALAQTATLAKPAAKPPTKPAAAQAQSQTTTAPPAGSKTLGGGAGSGPVLSFNELRACLEQEASVRSRLTDVEARRSALNKEREELQAAQAALRGDRGALDEVSRKTDDLQTRMKAFAARVDSWNERSAAFKESNRTGASSERMRSELEKEREAIGVQQTELEGERTRLIADTEEATRTYNGKVTAEDGRLTDWNQRNVKINQDASTLEGDREQWIASCSNRRYREDDEAAIRSGK